MGTTTKGVRKVRALERTAQLDGYRASVREYKACLWMEVMEFEDTRPNSESALQSLG